MKHTLLTLITLALSLSAHAASPYSLDYAAAGIKEPAHGSDDFFTAEGERQYMRRAVRDANLGDDMFVVTLNNVPKYIDFLTDFVLETYAQPITNYNALNEWLINTMGIAKSPADLKGIKPFLQKIIKVQPNLKIYASKLLQGPFAASEEDIFKNTAKEREQFLKMFQ